MYQHFFFCLYVVDMLVLQGNRFFLFICSVSENMPLYDILNEFQKGHSHIAVVYRDLNDKNEAPKKVNDGEQLDLKDKHKNNGGNASLAKGRDLNKSRITFIL